MTVSGAITCRKAKEGEAQGRGRENWKVELGSVRTPRVDDLSKLFVTLVSKLEMHCMTQPSQISM